MIAIDANMYLLCSLFNVSPRKLNSEYSGMSIEKIMEAEAAQGNEAAANFDKEVLSNPTKLIELFRLADVNNKYVILNSLSEKDLKDLLPLLEKEDLVMGLNFFTKDKLLKLAEGIPKAELVKMTFEMFSPEEVMQLMPEKELNKFLTSTELDKDLVLKHLQSLPPAVLAQMLEATTGQPVANANQGLDGKDNSGLDARALFSQIANLKDDKFKEALINIPPENKRQLVLSITKENPKLYELFSAESYTKMMETQKEKPDIIKAAMVLKPETLVKMIEELPRDLTAIVMTQIDPEKLAEVFIKDYKDILKQVVAA